jgi:hypothetical protein
MNETTTPKKRGGPRDGSGRPTKESSVKFQKVNITMTPEHYLATDGDRSGIIRRALDLYFGYAKK